MKQWVQTVELAPPSLKDNTADAERLAGALKRRLGAERVLSDPAVLPQIDAIRDGITFMELNVNQEFMNRFSAAKFLPHTNPELFPSVQARI